MHSSTSNSNSNHSASATAAAAAAAVVANEPAADGCNTVQGVPDAAAAGKRKHEQHNNSSSRSGNSDSSNANSDSRKQHRTDMHCTQVHLLYIYYTTSRMCCVSHSCGCKNTVHESSSLNTVVVYPRLCVTRVRLCAADACLQLLMRSLMTDMHHELVHLILSDHCI
jgi:hypothetical protein